MTYSIVGTAGHVDHGKTCLIKALTGVNTDRLKEEQKRGITIELGFARLEHDADTKIGIIDVPGHERFVKNMLSGIGGIDLVLLVVAADEGIQPQTREHFAILKLLRIKKGIIVITKADLADADWLELVKSDIQEMVKTSFLEKAPVIEVSAFTGLNITELKDLIVKEVKSGLESKNAERPFRLPVDRVFTMEGFGTVVTGTLMEGHCQVGDEVQLYPSDRLVKIRGLQVHGESRPDARAGQRTAINLLSVKKDELERGTVLASKNSMFCTLALDVKLEMLPDSPRVLKNRARVHVNIGADEQIAKVVLASGKALEAGESGYAQLRFAEQIAVKRGDRFVIRFFSPVETIGGGEVLDSCPGPYKKRVQFLEACQQKDDENSSNAIAQMVKEASFNCLDIENLALRLNMGRADLQEALKQEKNLVAIEKDVYIHKTALEVFRTTADQFLNDFHKKNPVLQGISKEEFKSRMVTLLHIRDSKKTEIICRELLKKEQIKEVNGLIAAAGYQVQYSDEQKKIKQDLEKLFVKEGFQMPSIEDVAETYKNKKLAKQIVEEMSGEGLLVKVKYPFYIHQSYWEKALGFLKEYKEKGEGIVLGEFRDRLGVSRKYAVLILEGFDEKMLTRKTGDIRMCL